MISLGTGDLELYFANKHATSLPGDGEMEYSNGRRFALTKCKNRKLPT